MDLSSRPTTRSMTAASRKRKAEYELIQKKKARFYHSFRRQSFALPGPMMNYTAKNPSSSKCYQKMIQSCKYFFTNNPILVLSKLYYNNNAWKTETRKGLKNINLENSICKLWVCNNFHIYTQSDERLLFDSLIPRICKCDYKVVNLYKKVISFDQLVILGSNAETLDCGKLVVKSEDGNIVAFEKIIEAVPKVKNIYCYLRPNGPSVTSRTFKELLKLPQFSTLESITMWDVPEVFDIEAFYVYMKTNKNTRFFLYFSNQLSEDYKKRLEEIIDEVLEVETHDYKFPVITFWGLDLKKKQKIERRQYNQ